MASKHERAINNLAAALEQVVSDMYGQKMGYALFMFPFTGEGAAGDYISNAQRPKMIKFMRELADRLERNDPSIIPTTIGTA